MKRVVVTGGSGKAGRAVVADLGEHGFDVTSVDVAASLHPDDPTLVADLTDLGQTIESLSGADAVVHLAAIPAPHVLPEGETFRINMMSTYNVFSAAVQLDLERVVWASSETLIGIPFEREQPRYAPIDEEHPRLPEFHYALSKLAGEVIAEQFSRWSGIPYVALRISNIMEEWEYETRFPGFWDDPTIRAWNLWGYVDRARCGSGSPPFTHDRCARCRAVHCRGNRYMYASRQPRPHERGLSRRADSRDGGGSRDAAVDRQGPARARV